MTIETLNTPTKAIPFSCLEYVVNVYRNNEFVVAYRYTGYSGNAMMEEVKELRIRKYPISEGYSIEW
jgi:hypothetical protein